MRAASDSVSGPTGWSFPPGPASHTSPCRSVTATTSEKFCEPSRHLWRDSSLPEAGERAESHPASNTSKDASNITACKSRASAGAPAPSTETRRPFSSAKLSIIRPS